MPKTCIVPGCKTGKKSCKVKCSVFKVVSDEVLRQKWEEAIPGIKHLKSEQNVCERHFEERFILRKWVKHDLDGKIIAEVPYKRIRLMECAIPSIFDNQPLKQSITEEKPLAYNNGHKEAPMTMCIDAVPVKLEDEDMDRQNQLISVLDENLCPFFMEVKAEYLGGEPIAGMMSSANPVLTSSDSLQMDEILELKPVPILSEAQDIDGIQIDEILESNTDIDHSSNELSPTQTHMSDFRTMFQQVNSDEPMDSLIEVKNEIVDATPFTMDEATKTSPKSNGDSRVQFAVTQETEVQFRTDSALFKDKPLITLPKPWCAVVSMVGETSGLIIFQVATSTDHHTPALKKSITIDSEGLITYYVHGKVVKESQQRLPRILNAPEMLTSIAIQFQSLRVCDGLGDIDLSHVQVNVVSKDNMNLWRANVCTLIGRKKKCSFCTRLRKTIQQKNLRYGKRGTNKRILALSNPIDQEKLNIMRKKLNTERRLKNRHKMRVKLLADSLR